nr:endogenous retrovirus group K member 7 Env polyprotein-like [Macaca fascicularis]
MFSVCLCLLCVLSFSTTPGTDPNKWRSEQGQHGARKEIWLPVNLTRPWGASPLKTYIWTSLQRTGHAFGLIIASVMSLVAIASTATVAGLALHQSIQNAKFVQQWHEQSHRLWLQQPNIYSQLAKRLDNMEQALTWLGDQLTVLSTQITLQCD